MPVFWFCFLAVRDCELFAGASATDDLLRLDRKRIAVTQAGHDIRRPAQAFVHLSNHAPIVRFLIGEFEKHVNAFCRRIFRHALRVFRGNGVSQFSLLIFVSLAERLVRTYRVVMV